jgi:hypothetical protein
VTDATTYTEAQVEEAAKAAMQLIIDDIPCDDEIEDLLSLLVNATLSVLTSGMQALLEDVITENYAQDLDTFKDERGF